MNRILFSNWNILQNKNRYNIAITKVILCVVVMSMSLLLFGCSSPEEIYEQGIKAREAGDNEKAFSKFELAQKKGNIYATYELANFYYKGIVTLPDRSKAVELYKQSMKDGDARAYIKIAAIYTDMDELDYAYSILQQTPEIKDAELLKELGKVQYIISEKLLRVKQDMETYLSIKKLLLSAMQNGIKQAEKSYAKLLYHLAISYRDGNDVTKDIAKAEEFLKEAIEIDNTNPDIYYCLAELKEKQKQFSDAVIYFEKAADNGLVKVAYKLGTYYEKGANVPKDLKVAIKWYRKGAENGDNNSYKQLVKLDPKGSFRYYSDQYKNGNLNAALILAQMYDNGHGTESNSDKAMDLYVVASKNGSKLAKQIIENKCSDMQKASAGMYSMPNPYRLAAQYDFLNTYCK